MVTSAKIEEQPEGVSDLHALREDHVNCCDETLEIFAFVCFTTMYKQLVGNRIRKDYRMVLFLACVMGMGHTQKQ